LARERFNGKFFGPEPAVSISPDVGKFNVKKLLKKSNSKHRAATPGMRQSKLFIGRP
jgi:hypothetical protein